MRAVCELLIAEYRPVKQRGVHDPKEIAAMINHGISMEVQ